MTAPKTLFVRPAKGLQVYDPDTKGYLPAEGTMVAPSIYWERRANDGDVAIGAPTQTSKGAAAASIKKPR